LIQGWEVVDGAVEENRVAVDWFRNRLNQVMAELEDDFVKFRLSEALMKVYKLVWDDFCSWYLEWIKPSFGAPIDRETFEATIALMGDVLAILHPFMPFITEELWSHLGLSKSFLAISKMPTPQSVDHQILSDVEAAIGLVSELRNLRQQKGLSPKESLEVAISSHSKSWKRMESMIVKLGNTSALALMDSPTEGQLTLVVGTNEAYITLSQNINKEEEIQKIIQEIAYQEGFLKSVNAKLSNEKFVAGAPEAVVANERKKMADAESKISSLQNALKQLQ
jgi:valyl-tRNA synthetase